MILFRRLGCVEIWLGFAVFILGTAVSNNVAGQAADAPANRASRDDPNSRDYRLPENEHIGGANRGKLLATINQRLALPRSSRPTPRRPTTTSSWSARPTCRTIMRPSNS